MNIKTIDIEVEEIILGLIILLNIFDFLHFLPPDLEFVKEIISFTTVGYLFYKINLSKIIMGYSSENQNLLIIAGFYLMNIKIFIELVHKVISESSMFMLPFYKFIIDNAMKIEYTSFFIGSLLFIIISIYIGIRKEIFSPSVLHILHEEGPPKLKFFYTLARSFILFIVFIFFYLFVFDLFIEWIGLVLESSLIIIAIFIYILFIVKHHEKFKPESLIFKIGRFGDNFYEKFIELFENGKTLLIAISGIIVLHLVKEIGAFIIPDITGFGKTITEKLGENHETIYALLANNLEGLSLINSLSVILIYLFNIIGIIMLFIGPAIIWFCLYNEQKLSLKKSILASFFSGFAAIIIAPIFTISTIKVPNFLGVDIQTHPINIINPLILLTLLIAIWIMVYFLSFKIQRTLTIISIIITELFLIYYIYIFFMNIASFYIKSIISLVSNSSYYLLFMFIIFLIETILFYAIGTLIFLYKTWFYDADLENTIE